MFKIFSPPRSLLHNSPTLHWRFLGRSTSSSLAIHPRLYEAVTSGEADFLKDCTDGVLLTQKTPKGNNILHLAAEFKHVNVFTQIPDDLSEIFWAANKYGDTPLHVAARAGCMEVIAFLIEQSKRTITSVAADMVSGAVDNESYKEELRVTNSRKDTAFHVAVQCGHIEVVNLLMAADPQLCCFINSANESPLFIAIRKKFQLIVHSILLNCPISPSFAGTGGVTALHVAANVQGKKTSGLVEIMLSKNPDMGGKKDAIGWTPLHYAALWERLRVTQILLHHSHFLVYSVDKAGMSPLHIAAIAGHAAVLKEMIQCRPDSCDLLNHKGKNILHCAVLGEQTSVIEFIFNSPNLARLINEGDIDGNSPLHLAANHRVHSLVFRLLTADPRVDKAAINNDFLHPVDLWTGQSIHEDNSYICLGRSLGVPFFHGKILHYESMATGKEIPSSIPTENNRYKRTKSLKNGQDTKAYEAQLLVAMLIATVMFSAFFTIPGGLQTDGTPVLHANGFLIAFLVSDAYAFLASIIVVCSHFIGINLNITICSKDIFPYLILHALSGMLLAFGTSFG